MDDDDLDARIWAQFVRPCTEATDTPNPTFFKKRQNMNESNKFQSTQGRDGPPTSNLSSLNTQEMESMEKSLFSINSTN